MDPEAEDALAETEPLAEAEAELLADDADVDAEPALELADPVPW